VKQATERGRAKTEDRHLQAGISKVAVFHGLIERAV
jgi:hypothetical protein